MKRKIRLVMRGVMLCGFSFLLMGLPVSATQTELDQLQENIQQLEQEQQESQQELENLEADKVYLDERLSGLNEQLSGLAGELTLLQEQQQTLEQELVIVEDELEVAKEQEAEQYANMKKRIRFLYERGNKNVLETLLEAKSFADFVNFAQYVETIHTYDREMLQTYTDIKTEIIEKETEILEKKQDLLTMAEEQKEKMDQVGTLLAEVEKGKDDNASDIAQTREQLSEYEEQLAKQRAYEEELEAQLAAEDAGRIEEIEQQEQDNVAPPVISTSPADIAMLAALIECEAGGESYEGKLAVGSVVMNRIRSSYFPNTLVEVIYQPRQFSPVASGRFAVVLSRGAAASCVQAATETLGGRITVDALYFRVNNGTIDGLVIGNHVFY